jgi:4a-hydroxytetrahydrobiopterin dehydratase
LEIHSSTLRVSGDWVVLHGGATAVFKVASLLEAAQLATALVDIVGAEPTR